MTFDPSQFIREIADPALEEETLQQSVRDDMSSVMSELAPAMWAVLHMYAMRDPQNQVRLNAVLNSAICATMLYAVALTPDDDATRAKVREKVLANFDRACEQQGKVKAEMAPVAVNEGREALTRMVHEDTLKELKATRLVLREAVEELRKHH